MGVIAHFESTQKAQKFVKPEMKQLLDEFNAKLTIREGNVEEKGQQ